MAPNKGLEYIVKPIIAKTIMPNKITYRKNIDRPLTSVEVDHNFEYIESMFEKLNHADYFVFDNGFSKTPNKIIINMGSKWRLLGKDVENKTNFEFGIDRTDFGKYRLDVIAANRHGGFDIFSSEENADGYLRPIILPFYLPYLYLYVSDEGIRSVSSKPDADFVTKLSYKWTKIDLQTKNILISEFHRNVEIIGGNRNIEGVKNGIFGFEIDGEFPDGYDVFIKNYRSDYLTIVHNATANLPIRLYINEDYFLRPNEILHLKYEKASNCFIVTGGLDIRLSYRNVDAILGSDSLTLFVDSSDGDVLDAEQLQTTLRPTVMRYFKDFTNDVVSWQWFRQSGTTQEDKDADEIWAIDKNYREIELSPEDFTDNIHTGSITFTCQAIVNNELVTATMEL